MKPIRKALREAKNSILAIALFHSALDTLVAFSLLSLGCLVFNISYWWAFAITAVYALIHTMGQIKSVTYAAIEKKAPDLEEQLITVADAWKEENNEIAQELSAEVLKKMKSIHTGAS